ncbi:MAG: hypothetical protein JWR43_2773 [Phenylobacterium sp.]|nr:hypothetical protein [Phenylobacterium sp.]
MDEVQDSDRGGYAGGGGFGLMVLWMLACSAVILFGLSRMHPEIGARVAYAFRDPALDLTKPFPNCKAAHAAGFYDIPRASPAYVQWQDPGNNGIACAPAPDGPGPDASVRTTLIWKRLSGH